MGSTTDKIKRAAKQAVGKGKQGVDEATDDRIREGE